jgi:hypothetical protein
VREFLASYILRIASVISLVITIIKKDWIWIFACIMAIGISFVLTILYYLAVAA